MNQAQSSATATTGLATMPQGIRKSKLDIFPYLLVVPTLIAIMAVTVVPTLYGIVVSLCRVDAVELRGFVGLKNYQGILESTAFWDASRVSFTFVIFSVIGTMILGFAMALLANPKVPIRATFRVLILLPYVTSYVVTYLIFRWIFAFDDGVANQALVSIGVGKVPWLTSPVTAMASLVLVNVWRASPYAMILLLAGLQAIPEELHEAASVDGAGKIRQFFSITLPLMKMPVMITLVLLTIIDFNVIAAMMVLTGGGPGTSTEPLSLLMYREAFSYFRMGPASALAMILFVINIVLALAYTRLLRTERDVY
jgi:multiple sugar transport system permease protein